MTEFWKDKRVLVTGHTGFKGTWICMMLEELGAKVYGYALEPDTRFYKDAAPAIVKECIGDLRDKEKITAFIREVKPEVVIHLAAHSTLNNSYELAEYIFQVNAMGLVHLLEALKDEQQLESVLVVTSDKCYKNLENPSGYTEDCQLGAQDPYSTSKACQELIAECYRNSLGLPICTARASNVIGGGDFHYERLLPGIIQKFLKGESAEIRKPNAIRPWQNVLDVISGYLILSEMTARRICELGPYNFGPDEDGIVSVGKLTQMVAAEFENANVILGEELLVKETNTLVINSLKSKSMLNWNRKYTLQETVHQVVEFEKKRQVESVRELCQIYIRQYFE